MGNTIFFQEVSRENSKIGWKDIFSESFVKHSRQDREYAMQVGTIARQVPEGRMLSSWHKPWLWWPMAKAGLALSAAIFLTDFLLLRFFGGTIVTLHQMCSIIPPLVIPLVIMIFFWELNVPQNISLGDMAAFYLAGALINFSVTALMFRFFPNDLADSYAALREEPAKLLACTAILYYIQKVQKKKIYGLTGLVVGAAVGAAFSGLESMSYAFDSAQTGSLEALLTSVLLRGVFAIAGHIAYCVPYSCAIALHADHGELKKGSFLNRDFLCALALSVGYHWIWNGSGSLTLNVLLCCAAPFRLIYWVRKCLAQIVSICGPARAQAAVGEIVLMCKTTALEGKCWKGSREPLVIGRTQGSCGLCFPADTPGISREHCRVYLGPEGWMVQDLGSTYGTYVDGRKLAPQESAPIRPGSNLFLGSRQVWITVL